MDVVVDRCTAIADQAVEDEGRKLRARKELLGSVSRCKVELFRGTGNPCRHKGKKAGQGPHVQGEVPVELTKEEHEQRSHDT